MEPRLRYIDLGAERGEDPLCQAVHDGLTSSPKSIPSKFFYDREGSELFERITELPEYYLTRCETEILERHAGEILSEVGHNLSIAEFGSGSSLKTRRLLDAALEWQPSLHYTPIDISRDFLKVSSLALLREYPRLEITAVAGEYLAGIQAIPKHDGPRLLVFLGSNIGNFSHEEATRFLVEVAGIMEPQDRLLVGADLVKDRSIIEAAYNDSQGVTAAFNLNLLHRINRELRANFMVEDFEHSAPYDVVNERVEMRLVCMPGQEVEIEDLGGSYHLDPSEFIRTEWSHKYTSQSFRELAEPSGLLIRNRWVDSKGWFAEFLLGRAS